MEPIAIVGMACRLPGAKDLEGYWQLLTGGIDGISEIPPDRWNADSYHHPDPAQPGKMTSRYGGFLDRIDQFDAQFFGISPREAARMDPQQRLLLETAWEAFEDAGVVPEKLAGSNTGVFVGIMNTEYGMLQTNNLEMMDAYTGPGSSMSIAANRLSYVFDLRGPSMAVDTACSSSLAAIHLACQSLRTGDSYPIAVAAGVNVVLSPVGHLFYSKAGVMSEDGRARPFDAKAAGFARGEGVGLLVLKPLSKALADGDRIHAVIRGSAVNQDGRTNGLMAPNRFSQEAVLREAYDGAGVSPAAIQYVEAHGTGTLLGDPIEAMALGTVLATDRDPANRCVIGSVKSNIGHLESAAGVAGVIKVALMLRHKLIPPTVHFEAPNPHIPFERLPLRVAQAVEPWPQGDGPALAGVSGFGYGGTNVHVVLEEAPRNHQREQPERPVRNDDQAQLLPLSARSPAALRALAGTYADWLDQTEANLADLCDAASTRRSHHDYRAAFVAGSRQELKERLLAFVGAQPNPAVFTGRRLPGRRIKAAFVFSGQGPQWWAMGRELLTAEPVFRGRIEACDALLRPYTNWSLLSELQADEASSRMAETEVAQPALFALQVALAALWQSWGISPSAVVGHSVGEVAAAHIAGVLSLEAAIRVIYHRSRLMQRATGMGGMATLSLSADAARDLLADYAGRLSLAAVNAPSSVVVAGESAALSELEQAVTQAGGLFRYLSVNYAFHSPQLDPFREELAESLAGLELQPATIPIYSTRDGALSDGLNFTPAYWAAQMRQPVLFASAIEAMAADGITTYIEIGPHPVLGAPIAQTLKQAKGEATILRSLRRDVPDREVLLQTLGMLYAQGLSPNWQSLRPASGTWVSLPTYAWQRERCWFETGDTPAPGPYEPHLTAAAGDRSRHPLLGWRLNVAHPAGTRVWQSRFSDQVAPYLNDHRIQGAVVVPGAVYLELAVAAAAELYGDGYFELQDLSTTKVFFLPEGHERRVQVTLAPEPDGDLLFHVHSCPMEPAADAEAWQLHASGKIKVHGIEEVAGREGPARLYELRDRCTDRLSAEEYYRILPRKGLEYGPTFRGLQRIWRGDGEALGYIEAHSTIKPHYGDYWLHPALLDACGHLLLATEPLEEQGDAVYMPIGAAQVRVHGKMTDGLWSYVTREPDSDGRADILAGNVQIMDEQGRILVEIIGLKFQRITQSSQPSAAASPKDWLYQLDWEPAALDSAVKPLVQPAGTCLVLADRSGVATALVERLGQAGLTCVTAVAGNRYEAVSSDSFQVRPDQSEDLSRLMDELAGTHPDVNLIIHLWSLDIPSADQASASNLEAAQALGVGSTVQLVQAIKQPGRPSSPRIWLVTRGAQPVAVEAGRSVEVGQAPLWGLGRTLMQEHAELWGGLVDLDPIAQPADMAAQLALELCTPSEEEQLAYRGGRRYAARLVRWSMRAQTQHALQWRTDASYLITGGLGGLGLLVARWMVEQGARRIILMGRTQLPPRSAWAAVAPETRLAGQIAAIRELEAMGAAVHLAPVDVADEEQLTAFLSQYRDEAWPQIRGVVHCAGSASAQTIMELSPGELAEIVRPKMAGAWLLHQHLADTALDFFVLFSSASSLLSSPRLAHYAAANAFLDALAHRRQAQGQPALSINWGPWGEVGMAARSEQAGQAGQQSGGMMSFIAPAQGLDLLGDLMRQPDPQAAVLPVDWAKWGQLYGLASKAPLIAALVQSASAGAGPGERGAQAPGDREFLDRLAAASEADTAELLTEFVREQVARVLRLQPERVDIHQPMTNLGLDSLMLTELKTRLEVDLRTTLSLVALLRGPSVAQLSEMLLPAARAESVRQVDATGAHEREETGSTAAVAAESSRAQALIDKLDQIADDEVDSLLAQLLTEEGGES